MKIHELAPIRESKRKRKRVGRGPGSGHGKTSCRGHKGQKSRSGGNIPPGFEGGQMPLHRRLPKRGFRNIFKKEYSIINIKDLNRFPDNAQVDVDVLKSERLVRSNAKLVKLLGKGELEKPIKLVKVHSASESAIKKIKEKGGKVELIGQKD